KINTEHITRLTRLGKMRPSGIAQVEAAKKDGRWEAAYASPKNITIPDDFLEDLAKNKKAKVFFDTLSRTNFYAIAYRLATAKKPETLERRKKVILDMLEKGETFH
ncbi:MAG: YdeI/OmpD-associated family protein, partial [Candidatus Levybacteria bacterium]|nr:YdeI/OmpD-associated family protein [Candidatus Levybacteria bacterium]